MNLEAMTGPELVSLHNQLIERLGEGRPVARFANREAGVRRVSALLETLSERTRLAKPEGQEAPRRRRGPYFVFKPGREPEREPQPGSRRAKCFALMRRPEGATVEEIMEECAWDYRKAYEAVRLIHYAHHFGLEFVDPPTNTRVRAYTKAERT